MALKYKMDRRKMRALFKKLRVNRGLTIVDVAEMFGVTHTTISNYELGRSDIKLDVLIKYCNYFNVPITNFLETTDNGINSPFSNFGLNEVETNIVIGIIEVLKQNRVDDVTKQKMNDLYEKITKQDLEEEA